MADTAYSPHEHLVAPGRDRPELWRLLVGLVIIAAVIVAMNMLVMSGLRLVQSDAQMRDFLLGRTPFAMFVVLGSFAFVILGVGVAARLMQGRGLIGIIGAPGLAVVQFWRVFRVLLAIGVVTLILPPYDMGAPMTSNLSLGLWLVLLPLSLLVVLVQTSAEEILFRGYIQQGLAARFSSPLIWMGLPAVLFAVGHYLPDQAGDNALLIGLWAGCFGLLTADLTARSGTLGPAIALHMFNNLTALLFIAFPESLSGLALYLVPFDMSDTGEVRLWLVVDFMMMLVAWLGARFALRR